MKTILLQLSISTVVIGAVAAIGFNASCTTQCGSQCCSESEKCTYTSVHGHRCSTKGKMIYCQDGLSYCIEPSSCCGVMSCCPSDTVCCGLSSCCAKNAVCCGMSTCCPEGSSCCGYSTCCSSGSQCVNGYCRTSWSSSMRWYYLVAVLIPFMFVLLYLAKRRQIRLAQQRGQIIRSSHTNRAADDLITPPLNSGYGPAPVTFEPPPYSEIANIPPEFLVNPEEKPPAYSELYNVPVPNEPSTGTEQAEATAGNQTMEDERGGSVVDNGDQSSEETVNQSVMNTSTVTDESKP